MTKDGGGTDLIPGLDALPRTSADKPKKPGKAAKSGKKGARRPAGERPVARIAVDMSLPHLDRPFDYLVPAELDAKAVPGCRVRVRFAGQLVDGFVLERVAESDHDGKLLFLERVTSPEPVLTPEIAALVREVAVRYAGTFADVLRLAVPPRHARVEAEPVAEGEPAPPEPAGAGPWLDYPAGESFLSALAAGKAPRAVWTALPGPGWTAAIARAVAAALTAGRGALVVVADGRDAARVDAALKAELGEGLHVALTAELGPAERYRRWLAALRGKARAVVGTRAAMFAPVADLGLVVLWDDGDDVHAEPHAPYPHPRDVLALRAHRTGAGALIGGFTRTTDATQLVETGWAHTLAADRGRVRAVMPRVRYVGEDAQLARDAAARTARLPNVAFEAARQALEHGPVLVQVPRRGYVPGIACGRCRTPAQCRACQGPLALASSHAAPYCRWCGHIAGDWHCPECGFFQVRAVVVGAKRTAEELGRAFPGVAVRTSGRDAVLDQIGPERALVVSTPGAEPRADGGYTAALLLDGWVLLGRPDLRAGEETLRRWMNAASLVRSQGPVIVAAEGALPAVQALVRWDPVTYAERELAERKEAGFPPATRMASLTASPAAIRELLADARLPDGAEVLGPVPVPQAGADVQEKERALIRVPRAAGLALARALKEAQGVRSARKATETVRVQIDPLELI
ncbi:primosomal protein N' [Actinomadura madurae]|uniref:Probable replication restart protein PriA n=1 Tax=Actinomadura madurae TaxID=1993 RepID=A0A1I4X4H5_9ACTN|nr:primosomal protein N' [Actinomadura madurae]SFN20787.1 replication restart DNA helicase PriA [Actinomadura madurae]SPT63302.1 Primosomal protein N' [Actinomadura madurae]